MNSRPSTVLNCLLAATDANGPTDVDLLTRFARDRDEAAFELLVWRHAGTVLRACRSVLRDHHAAEDACQATFLALARQAHAAGRRGTVAGWLYRVARRTAVRAARRRATRTLAGDGNLGQIVAPGATETDPEAVSALHDELDRLPDKYRAPILLCFFEGLSHADAAQRLGWPVGTVAGRVARAKERLCRRLFGRGIALPAAGLGVLVGASAGAVAPSFVSATARAAREFVVGGSPAVSNTVLELANGAVRTMIVTKLQWAAGALAVCTAMVFGAAWAAVGRDAPARPTPNERGAIAPDRIGDKADEKAPQPPKGKGKGPAPLPADLVTAWEKAGAKVGWMEREPKGPMFVDPGSGVPVDDTFVPAFQFDRIENGVLAKLPQPQQAFGLFLQTVDATDATLKELTGLTFMQGLFVNSPGVTNDGIKALTVLTALENLTLNGTRVSDAGLKTLGGMKTLRVLNLRYTGRITDAGLKELNGLKALRLLDLGGTEISDAGLKELAGLDALAELSLDTTPVTGAGLKELAGLKSLTRVSLVGGNAVTDAGLKGVGALKSLRHLQLHDTRVTDAGLKELAGLSALETLDLGKTDVTGAGLRDLAGLKSLSQLDLSGSKVTNAGLKGVGELKALLSLELDDTGVTDTGLKELAGLQALESLGLNKTRVTDEGLKELSGLKALNSLTLSGTQVTGTGLKGMTGLVQLLLDEAPVTDEGLKSLAGMKSLGLLFLNDTRVTDAGLKELSGCTSLKQLHLNNTKLTDAGLKELAGLKNLQFLTLPSDGLTEARVRQLQKALAGCKIIRDLEDN